jgi:hypothetical protein
MDKFENNLMNINDFSTHFSNENPMFFNIAKYCINFVKTFLFNLIIFFTNLVLSH